jgi:hypothetical protein
MTLRECEIIATRQRNASSKKVAHLRLRAPDFRRSEIAMKSDRDRRWPWDERIEFPAGPRDVAIPPDPSTVRPARPRPPPDRRSLRDPCGLQTSRSSSLSPAIAIARHARSRERKHARISCNLHPRPPEAERGGEGEGREGRGE